MTHIALSFENNINSLALRSTDKRMIMKKMTYDEYKDLCCQNNEQFSEMFDEFIDMENTADLKYQLDFDDVPGYFGIAARSEDSDVSPQYLWNNEAIWSIFHTETI